MNRKLVYTFLFFCLLIFGGCAKKISSSLSKSKPNSDYKMHHLVLFNFKENAPIDSIETAMYEYFGSIQGVNDLSFNKNVSSRDLDKGYKHSFYMTFESAYFRDSIFYPHPNYKKIGGVIGRHINEYLIYDFETPAKYPSKQ
jgi:hypothetical protein